MKKSLSILSAALLVALVLSGSSPHSALATDPCASAQGTPPSPGGDPVPTIAGTVTNASTSTAIAGASMYLYVCLDETSVAVTSTTTNSAGRYVFPDLDGPSWYYVAAGLTGPLANMVPASGTQNPTALVGVGEGDLDLDLAFE